MARSELLDTRLGVETPEGVVLELRPAGLTARFGAFSIDLAVRAIVYALLASTLVKFGRTGVGVFLVIGFLVEWFYPVFYEVWNHGATPGKRALNITVVEDNGLPVSFAASMIRNLLRFADFLPVLYGAAVASMVLSRDYKRLGDLAAGTRVVYADPPSRSRSPPTVVPEAPAQPVPLEVQQAVIALSERAPHLTPERIRELTRLADRVMSLPPTEGAEQRLWRHAAWFLGHRGPGSGDGA